MKFRGFFLFETLLLLFLNLFLCTGLLHVFLYERHYIQKQEQKISQWQNLMGFESLFSEWMSSFSVLACLYPIEIHQNSLILHGQVIFDKTLNRLSLYTGQLGLVTYPQPLPQQAWIITHDSIYNASEKIKPPFWLFQYEKQVLKFVQDKIYLEQEGHVQMLLEGLQGLKIEVLVDAIELSIAQPHFFKRYELCQHTKDLV